VAQGALLHTKSAVKMMARAVNAAKMHIKKQVEIVFNKIKSTEGKNRRCEWRKMLMERRIMEEKAGKK